MGVEVVVILVLVGVVSEFFVIFNLDILVKTEDNIITVVSILER